MSFKGIKNSESWIKIEELDKGWSSDKKYFIETESKEKLLLRISDLSYKDTKERDFELIRKIEETHIRMTKPIDFGICDEDSVYILLTWLDGEDLESMLPQYDKRKQYILGYQAGEVLNKIHSCKSNKALVEWSERFNRKIDRNIEMYNECPINYEGADKIIDYINSNRQLLNHRPQVIQHGDFHVGNMVISNDEIGIIDFDRLDIGDPWEEFNRITFCATISGEFASGMINGYFNNEVPDDFFTLLALYIGSNQLSSIPWAIRFGDDDVEYMLRQANLVLTWYKNFTSVIPSWYISH